MVTGVFFYFSTASTVIVKASENQYNCHMSLLSFTVFCIEMYADYIGKPSPEIFELFAQTGLLDMLESDYEDLHGMSWEYLMQMFDEYLSEKSA
jgi:hypothetical protein